MARILHREHQRYGVRIERGGDMHAGHVEFMDWANSYEFDKAVKRGFTTTPVLVNGRWANRYASQ